jgi:hypothetical protein
VAAIVLPSIFEFPGAGFGTSPLPAINPTPAPSTIPISFISDPTVTSAQIYGQVLTGVPFDEQISVGGQSFIELPLTPLPTPVGARVSIPQGAYPMDYQTAGSSLIEWSTFYTGQLATYETALATFLASASYATYLSAIATYVGDYNTFNTATDAYGAAAEVQIAAYATLTQSAAYVTWQAAGAPASGAAYNTYVASDAYTTYNTAESVFLTALDTWEAAADTYAETLAEETYFIGSWATYADAYQAWALSENAFSAAQAAYLAAGSPSSGSAYETYQAAIATSNTAGTTFNAAGATFASALETAYNGGNGTVDAAAGTLIATSDWTTYATAFDLVEGYYIEYVNAYNPLQSALNWWTTYAAAVNFFNRNSLAANPYSSANAI